MNKKIHALRFASALAAAALITACAMNDDEEPSNYEGEYEGQQYPERSAADRSVILGFGYDLTGEYAQPNGTRYRVLDYAKLDKDNKILSETPTKLEIATSSGTDINEYSSNISSSITANVSGGYGPASFSAEATHAFNKSRTETSLYAFSTVRALAVTNRFRIDGNADTLRNYLTSEFTTALTTKTPQELITMYGTHVMLGGVWGGRVDYNYSFKKTQTVTEEDVSNMAKVSAEASFGAAKLGAGFSTEQKNDIKRKFDSENTSLNYFGEGGTIGSIYSGFANEGDLTTWVNSLNANNATWIDFHPGNYLLPLYDFIADATKKEAVRSAMNAYFASKKITVTQESIPAPGSRTATISGTNVSLEGGASRVSGGDSDINSKSGRTTSWDLWVDFSIVNKRTIAIKTTLVITEDWKNNTKLQIVNTRNLSGTAVGDITKVYGGSSIHGSGKIGGENHGWSWVNVSGLSNVQIKIDGKGNDEGNIGVKFDLNNVSYNY